MKASYFTIIISALLFLSCQKVVNEPISKSLGKPQPVTDVQIQNVPGGAVISYRIPNQEDILSVKAVYTLSTGRQYEASSSFYENKVSVLGLNDTKPHKITLYTINRAQEMSEPVVVIVDPLESPISKVAKTMDIISDFGGAQYSWLNEYKAPLTFEFFTPDSLGKMELVRVITSKLEETTQSIRGYAPSPRVFGVVIKDYWGNTTDTLYPANRSVTPLYEEKLKKSRMTIMKLANDENFTNWEGMDGYIIDDDVNTFGHSPSSKLPAPFTLDLGITAKVSRIVMFQRKFSNSFYNWGNPKSFDVFIKADKPSQSGVWSEWTKLMTCDIQKPSGSAGGTVTDDDMRAAENGHEFAFDLNTPAVRYIRISVTSTWGNTVFTHPAEVDVYGQPK